MFAKHNIYLNIFKQLAIREQWTDNYILTLKCNLLQNATDRTINTSIAISIGQ